MLKRLVTGQFSLVTTFWGWGLCGALCISIVAVAGVQAGLLFVAPLAGLCKVALFSAVLSGITFILRRKITVAGVIAFLIVLIELVFSLIMFTGIALFLFK